MTTPQLNKLRISRGKQSAWVWYARGCIMNRDALKFLGFFPCSMTQGVALGQIGFDFLNKQTEILSAFGNVAD